MPQLVLEYSSNVIEKNDLQNLLLECHSFLEKTLPTHISGCKSRAIECQQYCVGSGNPKNAFVHVSLKILPGRDTKTQQTVSDGLLAILQDYFSTSLKKLDLQITLELMELQKAYFKITS